MTHEHPASPTTLGALLYAKPTAVVQEYEWVGRIRAIAARDEAALHELFGMAQGVVYALMLRMLVQRRTAEELTVDVFQDIWLRAADFDAAKNTAVGWIMNVARAKAIRRICEEFRQEGPPPAAVADIVEVIDGTESVDQDRPTRLRMLLAQRIAALTGAKPSSPEHASWHDPAWEQVAAGIECKLLATDSRSQRVSMLVRLSPGTSYPAHVHAGNEELHLLDGELWIDDRMLKPGDYNFGAPGHCDQRVWSQTGCTCVLITSMQDVLR